MSRLIGDPRHLALTLIGVCGIMLASALALEHIEGLAPCPMCLMQRVWVVIVGLIALIGLAHNSRWGIYPTLTSAASIAGGYFSSKQLWLQSLPEDQKPSCGAPLEYLLEGPLDDLLAAMTRGSGDCAEVVWSFLGISIPGWALLGFILTLAISVLHLRAATR